MAASLVSFPLRRTADVLSIGSAVLDRSAGILRMLAGGEPPVAPATMVTSTRGERASAPASDAPDPTLGRDAAERREPTPRPPTGATAAQAAGGRRPSSPKAARKTRRRTSRAASLTTIETGRASGRGGTPAGARAENTPKARARAKAGREPAPMGSTSPDQG